MVCNNRENQELMVSMASLVREVSSDRRDRKVIRVGVEKMVLG